MRSSASRSMAQAKWSKPGSTVRASLAEEPHALVGRPHFPDPVDGGARPRGHGPPQLRGVITRGGEQELVVLASAQRPAQRIGAERLGRGARALAHRQASTSTRAPTRLSAAMCPRSVARPSERSIIAVAQPEARITRLSATRGVGTR